MNLGIYINGFDNEEEISSICSYVNQCISNRKVTDASLFYNSIGSNKNRLLCGAFNSTDLWNFHGVLVCTSIECAIIAKSIVNNLDIVYYYGWGKKPNLIEIIIALGQKSKIVCRTKDDAKYISRVIGKPPIGVTSNFEGLVEMITGEK